MEPEQYLPPMPDLPVDQMEQDALDTLSYIFCGNIAFSSFEMLRLYFMAGLPRPWEIMAFWDEVEDLGYYIN